jgi:hypothetical protein
MREDEDRGDGRDGDGDGDGGDDIKEKKIKKDILRRDEEMKTREYSSNSP